MTPGLQPLGRIVIDSIRRVKSSLLTTGHSMLIDPWHRPLTVNLHSWRASMRRFLRVQLLWMLRYVYPAVPSFAQCSASVNDPMDAFLAGTS